MSARRAVQTLTACHNRFNTSTCWFSAVFMALMGKPSKNAVAGQCHEAAWRATVRISVFEGGVALLSRCRNRSSGWRAFFPLNARQLLPVGAKTSYKTLSHVGQSFVNG